MFVIIVGGGNTGSYLAKLLIDGGHAVKVIEENQTGDSSGYHRSW
jgi:Trk K+ transport system NAD-binding subunit